MQELKILQSLWAMERRNTDQYERPLEESIQMILDAGFDGVSAKLIDAQYVQALSRHVEGSGLVAEGMCYPKSVDDLKPVLEIATKFGVHHLNLQPDVRPRRLQDAVRLVEGWRRLAEQVDFPVLIETHRNRLTNDLHFTLDLLDCFPDLQLLGDLSHYLVSREFEIPLTEENDRMMHRILDNCSAFHGRVGSTHQIQVELSFAHNKPWIDLFTAWWDYGFRSWRSRAGSDSSLTFNCELGPKPYAISGPDGNDTTDRWAESLILRDLARDVWRNAVPPSVE